MFIDTRQFDQDRKLETDVCIVGSGPAGLALFSELDRAGLDMCLLESGGLDPSPRSQSLSDGEAPFGPYPFCSTRVRAFGGTTHRWTGICCPPEELDFEGRSLPQPSGWPLSFSEIAPYFESATQFFGLPPLSQCGASQLGLVPPPGTGLRLRPLLLCRNMRLGSVFRDQARQSPTGRVLLNTTAVEIIANSSGTAVDGVHARTLDGRRLTIKAKRLILAAGGIECPRLLLASRSQLPRGVGNDRDLVGRYFMERPHVPVGEWLPGSASGFGHSWLSQRKVPGGVAVSALSLSPEVRRRECLRGCWLRSYRIHDAARSASVYAHQRIWAGLQSRERPIEVRRHLLEMARDPASLLRYYKWRLMQKVVPGRGSPGRLLIAATVEQEPDPANRVMLSGQTDIFGFPLARLELRHSERYRSDLEKTLALFNRAFEAAGIGRIQRSPDETQWPVGMRTKVGNHHMGATRMDDDPSRGVVGTDCRVHGFDNLWIASSSVFPVSGSANPTLTIVALALRLAGKLASQSA